MPTYEYQCRQCGERLEVFQSFTAKSLKSHQGCGGDLHKVFHPSGIVFKGSGYYVTDSRASRRSSGSSSNGDSGSSEKSPDSSPSTDSKTKSDSKSDTKSTSEAAAS